MTALGGVLAANLAHPRQGSNANAGQLHTLAASRKARGRRHREQHSGCITIMDTHMHMTQKQRDSQSRYVHTTHARAKATVAVSEQATSDTMRSASAGSRTRFGHTMGVMKWKVACPADTENDVFEQRHTYFIQIDARTRTIGHGDVAVFCGMAQPATIRRAPRVQFTVLSHRSGVKLARRDHTGFQLM